MEKISHIWPTIFVSYSSSGNDLLAIMKRLMEGRPATFVSSATKHIDMIGVTKQLLEMSSYLIEVKDKETEWLKAQVSELKATIEQQNALVFDLQVSLDQQRIDTSADPKPCPRCGSQNYERLCLDCGRPSQA